MNYLNLLTRPITVTLQSNPIFAIELLIVIMVCVLYYMCMAAVNTLNNAANYARNKKHYKQYQNQSDAEDERKDAESCKILAKIDEVLSVPLKEHKRLALNKLLLPKFQSQTYLNLFHGIGVDACRRFEIEQNEISDLTNETVKEILAS